MKDVRIVECVPNFSEGRNMDVINQITREVESVKGVKLLDVDPGEATNRTMAHTPASVPPTCARSYL